MKTITFIFLLISVQIFAQNVAINTAGASPDPSAMLDLSASNQGFLGPRVADTNAVTSPAEGLIIYDLFSHCYRYRTNVAWTDCVGFFIPTAPIGSITTLNCAGATTFGTLYSGTPASGVSTDISYTGGNGGAYSGVTATSTGVTGLTATLIAGDFSTGSGSVSFSITGTPSASGTATFTITLGGQTCSFTCTVTTSSLLSAGCNTAQVEADYTISTNSLSGTNQTWITRNLGATAQATSATDAGDTKAGCYFQFNRQQAYGNDAADGLATVNPTWTITSISESSNWTLATDPCRLQLGGTWRIPTNTEWTNVDASGSWASYTPAYASALKLHAGGELGGIDGQLIARGSGAYFWSSVQSSATNGSSLIMSSAGSSVGTSGKTFGYPLRCLKSATALSNGCNATQIEADYGTVVTSLSGASQTWITRNLGSSVQASSATDASDAAAGCYFQFNRAQAYGNDAADGTATVSPAWTITSISETSNWLIANDPCALQLGGTWRIPTASEWTNVDAGPPAWTSWTQAYASVLKMHAAGYLHNTAGALNSRGLNSYYWSSVQGNASVGQYLGFNGSGSNVSNVNKALGLTLRCLK